MKKFKELLKESNTGKPSADWVRKNLSPESNDARKNLKQIRGEMRSHGDKIKELRKQELKYINVITTARRKQ